VNPEENAKVPINPASFYLITSLLTSGARLLITSFNKRLKGNSSG